MASILLVDDNAALLELQGEFLQCVGHDVMTASNGKEAMKLVRSHSFDLVITDLIMPEKEGIETIMELRQKMPNIKIIAMSGGGKVNSKSILTMASSLGAAKTLSKPFSGNELLEAVNEVLASDY